MVDVEDEIVAAGAEIIWIIEEGPGPGLDPGTAARCHDLMTNQYGATQGWCVGDDESTPPGIFDSSPIAIGRGFDLVIPRSTMVIEQAFTHGTPGGNDNPTAAEIQQMVEAVINAIP